MQGLIVKAISSFYYVSCGDTVYECKARGNFRKTGISPVVGDKVEITLDGKNYAIIEKVLDRKNLLQRPLISNIDKLIIVSAYSCPSPDTFLIDRLCALAEFYGIEPIIVFNKCDTGDFTDLKRLYTNVGYKTFVISAKDNIGTDLLKKEMENSICAFAGNSGVGKSSIINAIFRDLSLPTGEVSVKLGRGRHTTRHTELYKNDIGGYIADTPGFSSFDTAIPSYEFKLNLSDFFPEFGEYKNNCKFTSCTHTCEKGCGVVKALNDGKIEKTRHEAYVALFNELKDIKEWNLK